MRSGDRQADKEVERVRVQRPSISDITHCREFGSLSLSRVEYIVAHAAAAEQTFPSQLNRISALYG
jgi:hypothetical protein